jgi:enolase
MSDTPARYLDKFMLRFPEGMRDRIAEVAKANGRSMNAEIIARLQKSLADERSAAVLGDFGEAAYDRSKAMDLLLDKVEQVIKQLDDKVSSLSRKTG